MTNELLTDANEILTCATPEQYKWVMARLSTKTDKEAAGKVGIHPTTVSRWNNKADLDLAVNLLLREPREAALAILTDAVIDAATLKVKGLGARDKQQVATEILDRILGRPTQRQELSGKDGGKIKVSLDDILTALPDDFSDAVRRGLAEALSQSGN